MCSCDICGNSQCRKGSKIREECSEESESLEPVKITAIHNRTGSQYFKNARGLATPDESQ